MDLSKVDLTTLRNALEEWDHSLLLVNRQVKHPSVQDAIQDQRAHAMLLLTRVKQALKAIEAEEAAAKSGPRRIQTPEEPGAAAV